MRPNAMGTRTRFALPNENCDGVKCPNGTRPICSNTECMSKVQPDLSLQGVKQQSQKPWSAAYGFIDQIPACTDYFKCECEPENELPDQLKSSTSNTTISNTTTSNKTTTTPVYNIKGFHIIYKKINR